MASVVLRQQPGAQSVAAVRELKAAKDVVSAREKTCHDFWGAAPILGAQSRIAVRVLKVAMAVGVRRLASAQNTGGMRCRHDRAGEPDVGEQRSYWTWLDIQRCLHQVTCLTHEGASTSRLS